MTPRRLSLVLSPQHESLFVGDILRQELLLSSSVVKRIKWLPDGILLDGIRVPTRTHVRRGQTLSALLSESRPTGHIPAVKGPLDIRYGDQDFLVLCKPSGTVVHPTHCHKEDSLGNFLLYYYQEIGNPGDFHPVHRLDRGTSGLLVVALHPHAQERFKQQLKTPHFCREYLALVWGIPPEHGTISAPIYSDTTMKRIVSPQGREATTHYTRNATGTLDGKPLSLVSLQLETGRTHQIRVHMSHLGFPLLGDEIYGMGDVLSHVALHAHSLRLRQPVTQEALAFTAKPPEDFLEILAKGKMTLPDTLGNL